MRAYELGLTLNDLDLITVGMVFDLMTEKANDSYKYKEVATQADFDAFMR